MRTPRITADPTLPATYHCMSRVAGRLPLLDDSAKHKLLNILHHLARFCDIDIITFCMMSNHFHLLIRVPPKPLPDSIPDDVILAKLEDFYGPKATLPSLARAALNKGQPIPDDIRQSVLSRIADLSIFLQEFKQRFSRWYNRRHDRTGYLWGERFRSVLVEDCTSTLRAIAAYIDLNPVRAGLVNDPKDYRFCGYAAALTGDKVIRRGIMGFLGATDWSAASAEYRLALYVIGGTSGRSDKRVLDPEAIRAELARGGQLPLGQILRLRIRHMTDGVFLGSKEFVNQMWERHRDKFGKRRKSGARIIRGAPIPGLTVLRDLRVDAVG
ncbi:MAG: transposase [Verrucomicrobiae bacterium]|nr:transposase [Verrucomicrobiae bacterium]